MKITEFINVILKSKAKKNTRETHGQPKRNELLEFGFSIGPRECARFIEINIQWTLKWRPQFWTLTFDCIAMVNWIYEIHEIGMVGLGIEWLKRTFISASAERSANRVQSIFTPNRTKVLSIWVNLTSSYRTVVIKSSSGTECCKHAKIIIIDVVRNTHTHTKMEATHFFFPPRNGKYQKSTCDRKNNENYRFTNSFWYAVRA